MENRAGSTVKNLSGEFSYHSFRPNPLPPVPPLEMSNQMIEALVAATRKVSTLDGLSSRIPNMELFVSMYVRKEALLSSQIEGTQCTLEDVFDPLLDENTNRNAAEVVNFIQATEYAIQRLNTLPLCNRLIKETHAVLMDGVRGQEKSPGEFRRSQNWIGGSGSSLKNARYIPPNVEDMENAMSSLEKYMNDDDSLDPLIQVALIHYQFETTHPFLDGNGRVGRLLITLYLMEKKILSTPALYISYYLKMNRIEYYDRMTQIRKTGDYEQWVLFFLHALTASAEDAIETIDRLTSLHQHSMEKISALSPRQQINVTKLFSYLERNPIIEVQKTAAALNLSYNTISTAIRLLIQNQILVQADTHGRTKVYSYAAYLDILRKDT